MSLQPPDPFYRFDGECSGCDSAGRYKDKKHLFGAAVNYHCPYDEAQLRVSVELPTRYICPGCWSTFDAGETQAANEKPPVIDDTPQYHPTYPETVETVGAIIIVVVGIIGLLVLT